MGLPHDDPPDDGDGAGQAAYADDDYGNGLAWRPVTEATRASFDERAPDVVVFQEIVSSEDCPAVPAESVIAVAEPDVPAAVRSAEALEERERAMPG